MEELINILSALLTPLIAIIAVYIAYQQMLTNKNKFKNDLFDRRMEIFEEYQEFIGAVVSKGFADKEDVKKFNSIKNIIPFLLDENLLDYHQELLNKGIKLRSLNRKLSDQTIPVSDKRSDLVEKDFNLNIWFEKQFSESSNKFLKYLKIDF